MKCAAAGMPDKVRDSLAESVSARVAAGDPAGARDASLGEARERALERQERLGEVDDIIRHLRDSKGGRRDGRK